MPSFAPRRTETTAALAARLDSAQAAGDACPYDSNLIASLKSDHVSLRETLEELENYATHRQFAKIPCMLIRFSDALQNHLDEEREHFYRRVAMCVQDDPAKSAFVERASANMDGIARQMIIFTKHYKSIGVNRMNNDEFRHDLEVIATLLGDRIDLEETSLYVLYLPPQHAGQPQADESPRVLEYAKR